MYAFIPQLRRFVAVRHLFFFCSLFFYYFLSSAIFVFFFIFNFFLLKALLLFTLRKSLLINVIMSCVRVRLFFYYISPYCIRIRLRVAAHIYNLFLVFVALIFLLTAALPLCNNFELIMRLLSVPAGRCHGHRVDIHTCICATHLLPYGL